MLSLISFVCSSSFSFSSLIDLVVELPFKYIQSADYFAMGAVKILNELKCDIILFGSESNNINLLNTILQYN